MSSMRVTEARVNRVVTPIGTFLLEFAAKHGMNSTDLSRHSGISRTSLGRLINGEVAEVKGIIDALMKKFGLSDDEALDLIAKSKKVFIAMQNSEGDCRSELNGLSESKNKAMSRLLSALSCAIRSSAGAMVNGLDAEDQSTGTSAIEAIDTHLNAAIEFFADLRDCEDCNNGFM